VTPPPSSRSLHGILLKVASVAVFVAMATFVKAAGQLPAGQIVFFRSFFATLPVLVFLAWHRELWIGFRTRRPFGHVMRGLFGVTGMGLGFFALTRLPLPEAITLNYAQPLLVVVFGALFLGEAIRVYRWTAVSVGLVGVIIVSWPKLSLLRSPQMLGDAELTGVMAALAGAAVSAVTMLLVRSLVQTERTATIVLWFSLSGSAAALLTLPFGWASLSTTQFGLLVGAGLCGGIGQILLTEAYRYADVSTVAPFEYTSLILGLAIGYAVFDEIPTFQMLVGGGIVVAAGIFIIWREQQLGLKRGAARRVAPPQ
jgi:drug/metabolite transporter (DMT)-like permease